MKYLRRTSNYLEIIGLFDPTHMMNITTSIATCVETLRIESGCFLEQEFTKLISMNP